MPKNKTSGGVLIPMLSRIPGRIFRVPPILGYPLEGKIFNAERCYRNIDLVEKDFPDCRKKGMSELLFLVHFGKYINLRDDALVKLNGHGLVPGSAHDLADLVLVRSYREIIDECPIVAMADPLVSRKDPDILWMSYLNQKDGLLRFSMDWFGLGWNERWRFLARRRFKSA